MSIAAIRYIKPLTHAPSDCSCSPRNHGERKLKLYEKAVLLYLAFCHNPKTFCAWPSVPTIARDMCVSHRRIQQILERLICKGLIVGRPQQRPNGSSTSTAYFFCELGAASPSVRNACDPSFLASKTDFTGAVNPVSPPGEESFIEMVKEDSSAGEADFAKSRSTLHPLKEKKADLEAEQKSQGNRDEESPSPTSPEKAAVENRTTSRVASDEEWRTCKLLIKSEMATNALRLGWDDEFDLAIRDTCVIRTEGLVVILDSPNPDATRRVLARCRSLIQRVLKQVTGISFQVRVAGDSEARLVGLVPLVSI